MSATLVIPSRFCGPPRSGNGGWTAGSVATLLRGRTAPHGPVEVTLKSPPPLDTPMEAALADGVLTLAHAGAPVAVARELTDGPALTTVPAVTRADADAAEAAYTAVAGHGLSGCFVCGVDRAPGDGMRLRSGHVPDDPLSRTATPWTPTPDAYAADTPAGHADLAWTWAALDCPGGWTQDLMARPMVLGRMTAEVLALPRLGVEHVVVGQELRTDGRRAFTATTIHADGDVVARAEHVWFAIDPADFF